MVDNRSKDPDKTPPGQKPRGQKLPPQPDNKLSSIIGDIIAKHAVDANLFRLGSINPKNKSQTPAAFWWRAKPPTIKNLF